MLDSLCTGASDLIALNPCSWLALAWIFDFSRTWLVSGAWLVLPLTWTCLIALIFDVGGTRRHSSRAWTRDLSSSELETSEFGLHLTWVRRQYLTFACLIDNAETLASQLLCNFYLINWLDNCLRYSSLLIRFYLTMPDYYPRDVVSAVYATATWLGVARWLAGCPSHMPVLYQNG